MGVCDRPHGTIMLVVQRDLRTLWRQHADIAADLAIAAGSLCDRFRLFGRKQKGRVRSENRMQLRALPCCLEIGEGLCFQRLLQAFGVLGRRYRRDQPSQTTRTALHAVAFEFGNQRFERVEIDLPAFEFARKVEAKLEDRVEQRCLLRAQVMLAQTVYQLVDCLHWRNSMASFASLVTVALSGAPRGATQLPPTQRTGAKESHSGALAALMPPVGQNRH